MMLRNLIRALRTRKAPVADVAGRGRPGSPPPGDALETALALYRAGRHAEARAAAERAEAHEGRSDVSVDLRARCLQYERRFAEAAALYAELAPALQAAGASGDTRYADALIDWGLALLRGGCADQAATVLERAARAAPDHPPAVGCARFPALMRRRIDLPRRPLPPGGRGAVPAVQAAPVEIVYFFAGRATDARFDRYMALLEASVAAARRAQRSARPVVLTDRETPFPAALDIAVERSDLDREALMEARFRAIVDYLERRAQRGDPVRALFCDPDTLLVRPLDDVLDGRFDVAYTARSRFVDERLDHEPFVAGATFVAAADPRRPLRFFRHVLEAFPTVAAWPEVRGFYPRPIAAWRGDQVVPAAVIDWEMFRAHILSGRTDGLEIDRIAVGFLPSDPYCYTFEADVPDAVLAGKRLIDFKGARKVHLADVARRIAAGSAGTAPTA